MIHHDAKGAGDRFTVQRVREDGIKAAPAVEVPDPLSQVLKQTNVRLGDELTWYLESYLEYPYGPNQGRADRVTAAVRAWGKQAFEALFGQGQARDYYHSATQEGHADLHVVVASDSARVLAWPWEALHDPLVGDLAQLCRIERQLDNVSDPPALHPGLSRERIKILLVTARPYERDAAFRSISRPLVELIHEMGLPAEVKLLRPPTFEQLRAELQAHPGAYHIVHFDVHGGFGQAPTSSHDKFRAPQGCLMFERADGGEDPITGYQLSQLLREYRIPVAVLNACQSGTLSAEADDAFASVATSLIKAGARSVVAMGYSLYVSAAREFLPAFYRRLFESGSVAEATRAGRQALLAQPERIKGFSLQDWLVPVLYQQQPMTLDFVAHTRSEVTALPDSIPKAARLDSVESPHGLVGRDSAVLALERASRRPPAALLVHGLGGVGKTTLARGYIEWLARTQGLPQQVVWLSFMNIHTADHVLNRLVEAVFGISAMAAPDSEKWPKLVSELRSEARLIVWDNFESASGTVDAGAEAGPSETMPPEERQRLKQLLDELRGGQTRVLITSRSDEEWLGTTGCYRIPIGGLHGEERQKLAQEILADEGIKLAPKDRNVADLINSLEGHPLMMRAILPKLATQSAVGVMQAFEKYVPQADSTDPVERKLYATLRFVEEGFPASLKPLLYLIGLHEGFVGESLMAEMAKRATRTFSLRQVRQVLQLLQGAGLVHKIGGDVVHLHPALVRYLRERSKNYVPTKKMRSGYEKGFVKVMAREASSGAREDLPSQRQFFGLFESCCDRARTLAGLRSEEYNHLTEASALHALALSNLPLAQKRYEELLTYCSVVGNTSLAANAYHQLGLIARKRRDFDAAEAFVRRALTIHRQQDNQKDQVSSTYELGIIAIERGTLLEARKRFTYASKLSSGLEDTNVLAKIYHELGMVAHNRRRFGTASHYYDQAFAIRTQLQDLVGLGVLWHQKGKLALDFHIAQGILASRMSKLLEARGYLLEAFKILKDHGDGRQIVNTCLQLVKALTLLNQLDDAESYSIRSLRISEALEDDYFNFQGYSALGIIFTIRGDFTTAVDWQRRALASAERSLSDGVIAEACFHLAEAIKSRDLISARVLYERSLKICNRLSIVKLRVTIQRTLSADPFNDKSQDS